MSMFGKFGKFWGIVYVGVVVQLRSLTCDRNDEMLHANGLNLVVSCPHCQAPRPPKSRI